MPYFELFTTEVELWFVGTKEKSNLLQLFKK